MEIRSRPNRRWRIPAQLKDETFRMEKTPLFNSPRDIFFSLVYEVWLNKTRQVVSKFYFSTFTIVILSLSNFVPIWFLCDFMRSQNNVAVFFEIIRISVTFVYSVLGMPAILFKRSKLVYLVNTHHHHKLFPIMNRYI